MEHGAVRSMFGSHIGHSDVGSSLIDNSAAFGRRRRGRRRRSSQLKLENLGRRWLLLC